MNKWGSIDLKNVNRLRDFCKSLLCDPSTFPGKMAVVCSSIFMNLRFSSLEDLCIHGRYCLDTISSAVVQELEKKYSIDADNMMVVSAVDEYVMSINGGCFYARIMSACRNVTQLADCELLKFAWDDIHPDSLNSAAEVECEENTHIINLIYEISALRKCKILSELLHQIVNDSSKEDHDMNSVQQVDADELLPKVAHVIKKSLRSNIATRIQWHAECKYMISMCNERFLLGDIGYSLATVMQALKLFSS